MHPGVIAGIVVGAAAVIGGIVALMMLVVLKKKFNGVTINNGVPKDSTGTTFTNGDSVILSYNGSNIDGVDWLYSVDNGQNFLTITLNNSTKSYSWTIPADAYSDSVVIRVADAKDATLFYDTKAFRITPKFHLMTGWKKEEQFLIPRVIPIEYYTSFDAVDGLKLEVSEDGTTFTSPSASDTYSSSGSYIQWRVSSDLDGESKYVRISTTDLVARGYPREFSSTTKYKITFTSNGLDDNSTKVGTRLDSLQLFGNSQLTHPIKSNSTFMTFGQQFYFTFVLNNDDELAPNDFRFTYSIDSGQSKVLTCTTAGTNTYSATIPSNNSAAASTVAFRLEILNTGDAEIPNISIGPINIQSYMHVTSETNTSNDPSNAFLDIHLISSEVYGDTAKLSSGWSIDLFTDKGVKSSFDGKEYFTVNNPQSYVSSFTVHVANIDVKVLTAAKYYNLHHTYNGRTLSTGQQSTGFI